MTSDTTSYERFMAAPEGALKMAKLEASIDAVENFYEFLEQKGNTIEGLAATMGLTQDQLARKIEQKAGDLHFLAELAYHSGAELHVTFRRKE